MARQPLLLLDVDGVISLFGFEPAHPPPGNWMTVDGILHYLSATAGAHIRSLEGHYELAWCTGWEEKANEYLPHALGLRGPLPVISFEDEPPLLSAHWKLAAIDRFAGADRALAWVDDAHDLSCDEWALRRGAPTLLLGTDPASGITDAHVRTLVDWAQEAASE
jgi:hypothetical protein